MRLHNTFQIRIRSLSVWLLLILFSVHLQAQQKGGQPLSNQKSSDGGETYALVVGISDYQDEGIPDLEYADRDALAFAGFLQSEAGGSLDKDHLHVLLNDEATAGNVGAALQWLVEVAEEGDKVMIYFSGHGDVESTMMDQPGFLLCWDAPARIYIAGGTIGLSYLQSYISTLSLKNKAKVVLIADACRSGNLSGSAVSGSQITSANLLERHANEAKILSCQPSEYSIEGEQWGGGRGAFSYHLVNGLYGLADRNGDNKIDMMELRIYLEENVAAEVAPYSQLPVTSGDSRYVLAHVDEELLAEIEASRQGQLQMYSAIALRGQEEEILESVDTSIRNIYEAFELALEEKRFLEPPRDCAEYYYNLLMEEPEIKPLHLPLTRNYAAALQDDAQQILNLNLTTGLSKTTTEGVKSEEIYQNVPAHLQRAAQLLGKDHYIYPALMARKHFFQSYLVEDPSLVKFELRKAMDWQPNMPHAMNRMAYNFNTEQEDSILYYATRAMELAPTWPRPYTSLFYIYKNKFGDLATAFDWLRKGQDIIPNSPLISYTLARYFRIQDKWDSAFYYYNKAIEVTNSEICFPCAHLELGVTLLDLDRYEEAEQHFLYALYDPRSNLNPALALTNLGVANRQMKKYEKSLQYFNIAKQVDSTVWRIYWNEAQTYRDLEKFELAESIYSNALAKMRDTASWVALHMAKFYLNKDEKEYNQAIPFFKIGYTDYDDNPIVLEAFAYAYYMIEEYDKAIPLYKKALQIDPDNINCLHEFAGVYFKKKQYAKAPPLLKRLLMIDSSRADIYFDLATIKSIQGYDEEAYELFKKGLSKDSSNVIAMSIYISLRTLEVAEKYILKGIDFTYLPEWHKLIEAYFPDFTGKIDSRYHSNSNENE